MLKVHALLAQVVIKEHKMDELTKQVRYQKWAEIILAANNSGLTKSEFCKQNGISRKTLYNYQKKIREDLFETMAQSENTSIVEIPVANAEKISSGSAAVIHAGGITIEISDGISESTLMSIGRMIRNAL